MSRPTDAHLRTLDANANRAREGLRVLEDHARFFLERDELSSRARDLRHRLTTAFDQANLSTELLLFARDTDGDVGTQPSGPSGRTSSVDVVAAAASRATEAIRVLEETLSLIDQPAAAATMAAMRYDAYQLERDLVTSGRVPQLIPQEPRVYFLWDLDACGERALDILEAALAGGASWVQLRAKKLSARVALELGRQARMRTRACGATLIVNDRVDLARLVGADGAHVGQTDLPASAVRRLLGEHALVGGTTHSLDDIQREMVEPLDYVGFGPIGSTTTKEGALPPIGVEAWAALPRPLRDRAVPIGGIDEQLAVELAAAGARQVCVGSAIFGAPDPEAATRRILQALGEG